MAPVDLGSTAKLYGIFGHPIEHSLSPLMQNAAFQAQGLPHRYFPFSVAPQNLESAVNSLRLLNIAGINVTIPHKERIMPYLDEIDPDALQRGAVNTIKNIEGRLCGYNTDGIGFVNALSASGFNPIGKPVILLGAGGAAKGVLLSLLTAGVDEVLIVVRRPEAGQALIEKMKRLLPQARLSQLPWQNLSASLNQKIDPSRKWLLINSTPLGMQEADALPFPTHDIQPHWTVSDMIYRPYRTKLLREAKQKGAATVPGLGMLIHQGAAAFEIWTGLKAPLETMASAAKSAFNIQD